MEDFLEAVYQLAQAEDQGVSEKKLEAPFLKCREQFKRIEFILMYTDNPESRQINGPNLVTSLHSGRGLHDEITPHGLQVIEELIYKPEKDSRKKLQTEIKSLIKITGQILERYKESPPVDADLLNTVIWDALRTELFRIEALGITGFDVPVCLNAIPETEAALESFETVVRLYQPVLDTLGNGQLFSTGTNLLEVTHEYLKLHTNFNEFDRFNFIHQYLHPLSKWVQEVISSAKYIPKDPVRAVSPEASYLFDPAFFSPLYFKIPGDSMAINLGEKLFNDPLFSANGERSCASCHLAEKSYTDGLVKNLNLAGTDYLLRNTPSLFNVTFQTRFFYDSRTSSLESQALDVIHNKEEMGGDFNAAARQIATDSTYILLFNETFKKNPNGDLILEALTSFVRSLVSFDSRFDRNIRNEEETLTTKEVQGFNLFTGKGKCATCHFMPMFNGLVPPFYNETESEIIGVPEKLHPKWLDADIGKMGYTGLELHAFSFKTPGLRNAALSAPYMHNGSFETLEDVMDFYNDGGGSGQGLNVPGQTLAGEKLGLTKSEIQAIIAFLHSITDEPALY